MLLRLGFIPLSDGKELRADVEAFAACLGDALGDQVVPLFAPDYKSLLTALERNIAQIGWVPPILAAARVESGAVLPVAVAVRSGVSTYQSVLFTRSGSGIAKPADLANVRAAWVDRDSAGGYRVVRAALAVAGVDFAKAFSSESFLGTHAAVAKAVLERRADVGATYLTYGASGSRVIARAGWREVASDENFAIVAEAGPIPADFLGVHKTLGGARLEALQACLVEERSDKMTRLSTRLFQTDTFVRPNPGHLTALAALLAHLDHPSSMPPAPLPSADEAPAATPRES